MVCAISVGISAGCNISENAKNPFKDIEAESVDFITFEYDLSYTISEDGCYTLYDTESINDILNILKDIEIKPMQRENVTSGRTLIISINGQKYVYTLTSGYFWYKTKMYRIESDVDVISEIKKIIIRYAKENDVEFYEKIM